MRSQGVDKEKINLDTPLKDIIPLRGRRQAVERLEYALGFHLDILRVPDYFSFILIIEFLLGIGLFFVNWKWAVLMLAAFFFSFALIYFFEYKFKPLNVRELTHNIWREHYSRIRRTPETYNKAEIRPLLVELFSKELEICPESLSADARLC